MQQPTTWGRLIRKTCKCSLAQLPLHLECKRSSSLGPLLFGLFIGLAIASCWATFARLVPGNIDDYRCDCDFKGTAETKVGNPSAMSKLNKFQEKYKHMRDIMLNNSRDALTGYMFWTTERTFPFYYKRERYERAMIEFPKIKPQDRKVGAEWPITGLTMVGNMRMDNLRMLLETTFENKIPGDFVECGVWRGGASIFALQVIKSIDDDQRHVWLVDSFSGLPLPRAPKLSKDTSFWNDKNYLEVSLEDVKMNFQALGLLDDDRLHFCQGLFVDILPKCHPEAISVLRMDGDMYESTMVRICECF